jgi:hypothetical protein
VEGDRVDLKGFAAGGDLGDVRTEAGATLAKERHAGEAREGCAIEAEDCRGDRACQGVVRQVKTLQKKFHAQKSNITRLRLHVH